MRIADRQVPGIPVSIGDQAVEHLPVAQVSDGRNRVCQVTAHRSPSTGSLKPCEAVLIRRDWAIPGIEIGGDLARFCEMVVLMHAKWHRSDGGRFDIGHFASPDCALVKEGSHEQPIHPARGRSGAR